MLEKELLIIEPLRQNSDHATLHKYMLGEKLSDTIEPLPEKSVYAIPPELAQFKLGGESMYRSSDGGYYLTRKAANAASKKAKEMSNPQMPRPQK